MRPCEIYHPLSIRCETRIHFRNGSGSQPLWVSAINRNHPGMPGTIDFGPAQSDVLTVGRKCRRPKNTRVGKELTTFVRNQIVNKESVAESRITESNRA